MADDRKRIFATVIYPESCPANLIDIISDWHLPCFLSPLHDRDVNANGEPKKPHYHLLIQFSGKKSIDQVEVLFATVCGVGVEVVNDFRGYARYLCHLDNPEKAKYSISDVREFAGADYYDVINRSSDDVAAISAIEDYIEANDIIGYRQLCLSIKVDYPQLYRVLVTRCTVHFTAYCKSRYWEIHGSST